MKKSLLLMFIIMMLLDPDLNSQKIGLEHYLSYTPSAQQVGSSSIFYIQHGRKWDTEIRHNYDMDRSFSFNAGRTFDFGNKISSSLKPMIGVVIGPIKGMSLNLQHEIEWDRLFFSSQSQFFISIHDRDQNFLYTWLEAGIYFSKNFFGGLSVQGNFIFHHPVNFSKGVVVGFSSGRWSFPVYIFEPFNCSRNIAAGILFDMDLRKPT